LAREEKAYSFVTYLVNLIKKLKMKKSALLFALVLLFVSNCIAQTDTIFTNGEKISCSVREITENAVKYVFPGEEISNSVFKNAVQKIIFKSGRVQTFAEATSYKTVKDANDFENVITTIVFTEVQGLYKLGDVSSKARGTTGWSSMEQVKERAYKKLKIEAAMMGANIVYLSEHQTLPASRDQGSTSTSLSGVAYSSKLPNYDDFVKQIGNKTHFQCLEYFRMSQREANFDQNKCSKDVQVIKIYNESGLIMMKAKINGEDNDTYRVISFSKNEFVLAYKKGERIYNFKIQQ